MEQDSTPATSRFLPAQLLQQKLLKFQRKEEAKSMKKGNKIFKSSKSDGLLSKGIKDSSDNAPDNFTNEDSVDDDDNGVDIPGSLFLVLFCYYSTLTMHNRPNQSAFLLSW